MILKKLEDFLKKKRCYCESQVNKEQLENLIKDGAILVDVRSTQEYEEEHLENAISIPYYDIKHKASYLLKNKSKNIIVYCNIGHRSKKAQKILRQMGYKNVYNLCTEQDII